MISNDLLYIDELHMYYGLPYIVTDQITVQQPTIRDIRNYGEQDYFNMVSTITSTPTSMMSELDDIGLDYSQISDFQLFIMLTRKLEFENTRLLFPNLDFSGMDVGQKSSSEELLLLDRETGIIIDELVYERMINFVRKTHGIKAQKRKAANKATRLAMIANDRDTKSIQKKKNSEYHSLLLPMIITLTCTEEFKYNDKEILNMTYCQLSMAFQQIQKKKNALALLAGYYSGSFDNDKFKKDSLIWTYEP